MSHTASTGVPAVHLAASAAVAIRRATPADADDVAGMVREIAAHEDQSTHVHVDGGQWRTLLARPDVVVLLAERDGRAVGYVSAVRQLHLWTGGDVLALDDLDAQRFHRRFGATLRPTVVAAWAPAAYTDAAAQAWSPPGPGGSPGPSREPAAEHRSSPRTPSDQETRR